VIVRRGDLSGPYIVWLGTNGPEGWTPYSADTLTDAIQFAITDSHSNGV